MIATLCSSNSIHKQQIVQKVIRGAKKTTGRDPVNGAKLKHLCLFISKLQSPAWRTTDQSISPTKAASMLWMHDLQSLTWDLWETFASILPAHPSGKIYHIICTGRVLTSIREKELSSFQHGRITTLSKIFMWSWRTGGIEWKPCLRLIRGEYRFTQRKWTTCWQSCVATVACRGLFWKRQTTTWFALVLD